MKREPKADEKGNEYYCQMCGKLMTGRGNIIRWPNNPEIEVKVCKDCFIEYGC